MSLRAKISAVIGNTLAIGLTTASRVLLKNNGGVFEARDNADAAYIIGRGADPVAANDWVTYQYYYANMGATPLSTIEVDFGANLIISGSFDITGLSGLTPGNPIFIQQAPGPYTGKPYADEAEWSPLLVSGYVESATTIRCYWNSLNGTVNGNFIFLYRT